MSKTAVSIVITYYERLAQLRNTLESFRFLGYGDDVEVVIVDDASEKQKAKEIDCSSFKFPVRQIAISKEEKWYTNPCVAFNRGIREAQGRIVILQNAECLHFGNIVDHARTHLGPRDYFSYGCYSIGQEPFERFCLPGEFGQRLKRIRIHERPMSSEGQEGWYNHSLHRPVGLHFCSAITGQDLRDLGGFDERYARGVAFDDNEFLFRIRKSGFLFRFVDTPYVVHQWHYEIPPAYTTSWQLHVRNHMIFEYVTKRNLPYGVVVAAWRVSDWARNVLRRVGPLRKLKHSLFH